jgi:hypothetical protein
MELLKQNLEKYKAEKTAEIQAEEKCLTMKSAEVEYIFSNIFDIMPNDLKKTRIWSSKYEFIFNKNKQGRVKLEKHSGLTWVPKNISINKAAELFVYDLVSRRTPADPVKQIQHCVEWNVENSLTNKRRKT